MAVLTPYRAQLGALRAALRHALGALGSGGGPGGGGGGVGCRELVEAEESGLLDIMTVDGYQVGRLGPADFVCGGCCYRRS